MKFNTFFYKETNFKETSIGKIPKDWKVAELREIGNLKDGDWILKENYTDSGVRLLQIGDIGVGRFLDKSNRFISLERAKELKCTFVRPEEDILISRMPDPIGRACLAPKLPYPYIVAVDITILRVKKEVANPEYIVYILNAPLTLKEVEKLASGATRRRISRRNLEKIKIPLPPLNEQKAIAQILFVVDKAIWKTDEIITKTKRLKKGLIRELLTKGIGHKEFKDTEIGRIPKEWEVTKLGNVVDFENGRRPRIILERGRIPIYGAGGLAGYTQESVINQDFILVIARVGVGSVGKVYLAKGAVWISDNAIYSKCYNSSRVYLPFVYYLLMFKRLDRLISRSGAGGYAIITQSSLRNIRIQLPKLHEQRKIAEILSTVDKKLEIERKRKKKLERIRKGLMDLLLTGKVRVKVS